MFNTAHLSKFVNFNLIILSKLKCIVNLTDIFCSVVASGTSHFYSFFFSYMVLTGVDLWYDIIGLWAGKKRVATKPHIERKSTEPLLLTSAIRQTECKWDLNQC